MNANRRALFATASVAAIVACTPSASGTTTQVEQVIAQIQAVLPFVDVLVAGLAIAVPGAAGVIAAVQPYLGTAQAAFNTLSSTMTASSAATIVTQIENAVGAAVEIISQVVNAPGGDPKLAKFGPLLIQVAAVLRLLNTFVDAANGVISVPKAAAIAVPKQMHIRVVK